MLLETKIRAANHSIMPRVCGIDSGNVENTKTVSLKNKNINVWAELIRKVEINKDVSAFEEIFSHFAPRVKAFLMKSGADPQMAEECTQEEDTFGWFATKKLLMEKGYPTEEI